MKLNPEHLVKELNLVCGECGRKEPIRLAPFSYASRGSIRVVEFLGEVIWSSHDSSYCANATELRELVCAQAQDILNAVNLLKLPAPAPEASQRERWQRSRKISQRRALKFLSTARHNAIQSPARNLE